MAYAVVLFLPLVASLLCAVLGVALRWGGARFVSTLAAAVCAYLSARCFLLDGAQTFHTSLFEFVRVGELSLSWGIYVDQLTRVMLFVVCSVSFLVNVYSLGYMSEDPGRSRFFSYLSFFTFAMLALVTAPNFVQLFFGWEGVGLASYLLIGFWFEKESANSASVKAFITNRVGDLGLILGMALIFSQFHTLDFEALFHQIGRVGDHPVTRGFGFSCLDAVALLLFLGAMGKSAQIFLHVWLPDAMEGPTPVSALIHAATMVTAGVFLLARCHPLYELSHLAQGCVMLVGASTALMAATLALVQTDIKRVIAYSTCSQLGYMFVAMACGGAYGVGIFHLFTHAFFKALLFLCAGSVIHSLHHEQDMRKMGGLCGRLPFTWLMMVVGTLSITGFPLTAGYYSKDAIIEAAYASDSAFHLYGFWVSIAVVFLTSLYSWRLVFMVFHGPARLDLESFRSVREAPLTMAIPLLALSLLALTAGYFFSSLFIGRDQERFWAGLFYFHESSPAPHTLFFLTSGCMLLGMFTAWIFYSRFPDWPVAAARLAGGFYVFLTKKWYFDVVYRKTVVAGVFALGRWGRIFDKGGVDAAGPGAVSCLVRVGSARVSSWQTGYIRHYALVMATGVLVSLSYLTFGT